MFTKNMWSIYRKWMIIAILSGCVYVFGYSDNVSIGFASAPCIQECESNQNGCNDLCDIYCREDSTDAACSSCFSACSHTYFQCLSYAVSCQNLDVIPGHCSVEFGLHCVPYGSGLTCNTNQGAYYGYYLMCHNLGGAECVSCTEGYCYGVNPDIPWCFAGFYP